MEQEIRTNLSAPNITGRTISGYAIVFNQRSEILLENNKRFVEVILPSAITQQTLDNSDIKFTIDHNRERLLARRNKGKGTLTTKITPRGVYFEFLAPKTADGEFAVEMVNRGDISGASFAFRVSDERWEKKDGQNVRFVTKISQIFDMTLAASPAYSTTSAQVRSRICGTSNTDYSRKIHEIAREAGIAWTPKEKIQALRQELDDKEDIPTKSNNKLTVQELREKYNL